VVNGRIPLSYATPGEESVIKRIGGSPEVKKHLENLGFVVGGTATVITSLNGNVIVKVKESRVAINDEMARRIMI
jgi:ferrous iron transport protein A